MIANREAGNFHQHEMMIPILNAPIVRMNEYRGRHPDGCHERENGRKPNLRPRHDLVPIRAVFRQIGLRDFGRPGSRGRIETNFSFAINSRSRTLATESSSWGMLERRFADISPPVDPHLNITPFQER